MSRESIQELEQQIFELCGKLQELHKSVEPVEVPNYTFESQAGSPSMLDLFGEHDRMLLIHNMGQGCRYCTLWADGFNGFLPHLENAMSVVLVSKDSPELQRRFAKSRGWHFRMASHGGGEYMKDQASFGEYENNPGAATYERRDGKVYQLNKCMFGPGDLYCPLWNLLGLAGIGSDEWTPQFRYWSLPEQLDDGGANVQD